MTKKPTQRFKYLEKYLENTSIVGAVLDPSVEALDSSVSMNPFIGFTKISQRRAISSHVQFLALQAFFYPLFLSPFFNNR